ncbi:MAG TPA: hypothetical protein DCX07_03115 [Phycisphaerales bacterium]|nr:hypothetical protein [Phycisphaerales bacterium]
MERMAPGVLCRDGFLGGDDRPLGEILDADRAAVEAAGLTHEEIVRRLGEILRLAMARYGAPVEVGGGLTAVYVEAMGRIPCPWGGHGVFAKGEVRLADRLTGRQIVFTPLSVHLVDEHGFYQGKGSRYRLEPRLLAELLRRNDKK